MTVKLKNICFLFSKWTLDWDRLICTEGSSASSILIRSCADLFKEGLVSAGLELVAGLRFCQESSRYIESVGPTCILIHGHE